MSDPRRAVLDASALLAYLQGEPGAEKVRGALAVGCCMSSVNWAEVLSKVAERGTSSRELTAELTRRRLLGAALQVLPFEEIDAAIVGDLRPKTRSLGLSLGDRACLALGKRLGEPVLTSDKTWLDLDSDLGVEIQSIR